LSLSVEAGQCDAPYMSTLWHQGQVVGETTSGAWGYRVGHSMALGMLRADLAVAGTEVEVEIFGETREGGGAGRTARPGMRRTSASARDGNPGVHTPGPPGYLDQMKDRSDG
jgi:glycine cleavage system aminomethyltransferase T